MRDESSKIISMKDNSAKTMTYRDNYEKVNSLNAKQLNTSHFSKI